MDINNPVNQILRIELNMTQDQLAKKIGVCTSYLNSIINGSRKSEIVRRKIARALNLEVSDLWPEKK